MIDRNKVINGLEACRKTDCINCPYSALGTEVCLINYLLTDALALLQEQEAVVRCKDCIFGKREKNESTGMTWIYCGHHRENRPEDWFCASGSRI